MSKQLYRSIFRILNMTTEKRKECSNKTASLVGDFLKCAPKVKHLGDVAKVLIPEQCGSNIPNIRLTMFRWNVNTSEAPKRGQKRVVGHISPIIQLNEGKKAPDKYKGGGILRLNVEIYKDSELFYPSLVTEKRKVIHKDTLLRTIQLIECWFNSVTGQFEPLYAATDKYAIFDHEGKEIKEETALEIRRRSMEQLPPAASKKLFKHEGGITRNERGELERIKQVPSQYVSRPYYADMNKVYEQPFNPHKGVEFGRDVK